MATCRDIEPLITASVDGVATGTEQTAVGEHLRGCQRCRARASQEAVMRRVLTERAEALHVTAPAELRAKCQPPPRRRPWFAAVIHPVPAWATIGVVVLVFAAVFYVAGRGSTAMAAELALDHLKCFALFEKASGPGDPGVIAARLKASYGWSVTVPPASVALGLQLVGGRRCFSTDGRVAHILYRHGGRPLSLFIVPRAPHAAAQLAVLGHHAIIWSRRDTTYVVLAQEPGDQVARVADYMRSVVQ